MGAYKDKKRGTLPFRMHVHVCVVIVCSQSRVSPSGDFIRGQA